MVATRSEQYQPELKPLLGELNSSGISKNAVVAVLTGESKTLNDPPTSSLATRRLRRAGVTDTVLNLMKTCMGTGVLALAYACQQGGVVLFSVGLVVIALWNVYAVQRLCHCLELIPSEDEEKKERERNSATQLESGSSTTPSSGMTSSSGKATTPPEGTSTFGRVAWYSFGATGLRSLDAMLAALFFGILTAYVSAVASFIADTPLSLGKLLDSLFAALIMASLSIAPGMENLARGSALGLTVLFFTMTVIAGYGVLGDESAARDREGELDASSSIYIWPQSLDSVGTWFGIALFGYGVVPLTYNFRESMAEPSRLVEASLYALLGVATLNTAMGVGLYWLYPRLAGDLLHELPLTGFLPVFTRLAMSTVVIVSTPLLLLPCGQWVEGRLKKQVDSLSSPILQRNFHVFVRFGILFLVVCFAVLVPSFVGAISLVGCVGLTVVGFCLPPLFHMRLSLLHEAKIQRSNTDANHNLFAILLVDGFMLLMGMFGGALGTAFTLIEMIKQE